MEDVHQSVLGAYRLSAEERQKLTLYLGLVADWNERTNLTGARTARERAEILIGRVLPARRFVLSGRMIDVGSGNGSPAIVFAVLCRPSFVTLLEPRAHRWAFLREVQRLLGLDNIAVLRKRHDEYSGPPAETVTVRGLTLPRGALERFVTPGGRLLSFGGRAHPGGGFQLVADLEALRVWGRCST